MKNLLVLVFLFSVVSALNSRDCANNPKNPGCGFGFVNLDKSPKSMDPPAIPEVIPERIKKFCETDPSYDFCKDLGLGKDKKMFQGKPENMTSVNFSPQKYAIKGEEVEKEEMLEKIENAGKKIDCETSPSHPGCQRNIYLDAFIAWKIGKDCEVDPNGQFCPKTLGRGCVSTSSESEESSSSESSSSESQEIDEYDELDTPEVIIEGSEGDVTPSESSETDVPAFLRLLWAFLNEMGHHGASESSESSSSEDVEPHIPKTLGTELVEKIMHLILENLERFKNMTPSERLAELLRLALESSKKPASTTMSTEDVTLEDNPETGSEDSDSSEDDEESPESSSSEDVEPHIPKILDVEFLEKWMELIFQNLERFKNMTPSERLAELLRLALEVSRKPAPSTEDVTPSGEDSEASNVDEAPEDTEYDPEDPESDDGAQKLLALLQRIFQSLGTAPESSTSSPESSTTTSSSFDYEMAYKTIIPLFKEAMERWGLARQDLQKCQEALESSESQDIYVGSPDEQSPDEVNLDEDLLDALEGKKPIATFSGIVSEGRRRRQTSPFLNYKFY
ncbi:hypothetical protein B9Z55_004993 [Caenorhabditis nigoni]|uniref:Uncharacterized protein n=1 Tax=Caenorhabditis nigoni TaxID=1611254 RepID=A0A2G5UYX0_9PELO|nr:hypothetical protein B9Z55_004993 [Caenorhabditis nigoni]